MVYLSIDFIPQLRTPQSDCEGNAFLSAARTDNDHAATAASSWASAAEAASEGRLSISWKSVEHGSVVLATTSSLTITPLH